jgi:lipoate---protein ligase
VAELSGTLSVPPIDFLDLTLPTVEQNLALDEALLLQCESGAGHEVLRVWDWPHAAVILGAACAVDQDVDKAACQADSVPILRRSSGGGTVLLGPGCLLYSLILRYSRAQTLRQIGPSYCHILNSICTVLAVMGLQPAGISDLARDSLKVSGNAQQRKRDCLLHHGTLLYAFDAAKCGRYLRMPARQPEYRRQRTDSRFLTNLPLRREEMVRHLRQAFGAEREVKVWPDEVVGQLVANKYALAEWTRRRG